MSTEIERKFLIDRMPDLSQIAPLSIHQGYLTAPGDSVQVRLRRIGARHVITAKGPGLLSRSEHETEITEDAFNALWPATAGRRLRKTRWRGELAGGLVYELDVFTDHDLRLVEVEFLSVEAAQVFEPPEWFGREVTTDPAYSNSALAAAGGGAGGDGA